MKKLLKLFIAAFLVIGSNSAFAQTGGLRIVTGHPDFKIRLQRCVVSDKTCVIDMILTNTGNDDIDITFCGGGHGSKAYDDEGNTYLDSNFLFCYASNRPFEYSQRILLPAGVPIKARIQIEGVAYYATTFARIDFQCICREWGLNRDEKYVKMYNIPITRDGD